jgi:TatA/E family protein of Tat protein translocase
MPKIHASPEFLAAGFCPWLLAPVIMAEDTVCNKGLCLLIRKEEGHLMFGTLGMQEMIVIFLVALVLFGPKKLPELGKTIGKAITEFRRASNDLKSTFDREMQNLERETIALQQEDNALHEVTHNATSEFYSHSYGTHSDDLTAAINEPLDSTATHPPTTVGASEVPGAESQGHADDTSHTLVALEHQPAEETAPQHPEGTVPHRHDPQVEKPAETPQHS